MASYGIFIVLIFIVAVGIVTIAIDPMVNEMISVVNPYINDGALSTKYVNYFNLSVGIVKALPVFVIIGLSAWGIVRALEKRDSDGGF